MSIRLLSASALAGAALTLTACSGASDEAYDRANSDLTVAAAFYPLAYVASAVAGEHSYVQELTTPGVEPHDLELSPSTVRKMQQADVVVYLSGFQAAVDDAISSTGVHAFDAESVVDLEPAGAHGHEGADHNHDHDTVDPHFWLDPTLLAGYATAVGTEFATLDPDHADDYAANAAELVSELSDLDASFSAGLAQCERSEIFVIHEAFGYLTARYGLHQEGLSGIDPEAEPSPSRVREVRDQMAAKGATTIFAESQVSTRVAKALAADAGVATAVLNPVESVVGEDTYMTVMNRNLATLRTALDCA